MADKEFLKSELEIATQQVLLAYDQLRIEHHSPDYKAYLNERAGYWRGRQVLLETLVAELEDN